MFRILFGFMLCVLLCTPLPLAAQSSFDWGWSASSRQQRSGIEDYFVNAIADDLAKSRSGRLIGAYREHVSPIQGHQCPCLPTCSVFTLYSIEKYGFFVGLVMGVERLYLRENLDIINQLHYMPVLGSDGSSRVYDPPEANFIFKKYDWRIIDPDLDILRLDQLRSSDRDPSAR
jgi:hypothetical protein